MHHTMQLSCQENKVRDLTALTSLTKADLQKIDHKSTAHLDVNAIKMKRYSQNDRLKL